MSTIFSGEKNLFLIRVQRLGVTGPGLTRLLGPKGSETVLTVCSGQEAAKQYIAEERAAGLCKVWIASIGDLREERFVEQTID